MSGPGVISPTPSATVGTPGAAAVVGYWIDTVAGSDANPGTQALPFATFGKWLAIIGRQPIDGIAMSVTMAGTDAGTYTAEILLINGATLNFYGTRAVALSTTLAAVTPWAGSSQQVGLYTLAGAPNITASGWQDTAYVQDHATPTIISPISKDRGSGQFAGCFVNESTYSSVEPTNGHAVDVYTIGGLTGEVNLSFLGAGSVVNFYDFVIGNATAWSAISTVVGSGVTSSAANAWTIGGVTQSQAAMQALVATGYLNATNLAIVVPNA